MGVGLIRRSACASPCAAANRITKTCACARMQHSVRERNASCVAADRTRRQLYPRVHAQQRRNFTVVHAASDAPPAFANSQLSERDSLKTQLIRATANTQRGRKATQKQQEAILQAATALEALNPTDSPATSPLIDGRWSLLYQGPEEVTQKREPLEGPVIDLFRPILGFLFRTLGVYQVIDAGSGAIDNLVEFKFASAVRGSLNVAGTVAPAQAQLAGGAVTRVDVKFTAFRLQLGWLAFSLPLGWADPKGWVETTYVDDSFRIGHGDKGSIFITSKARGQGQ